MYNNREESAKSDEDEDLLQYKTEDIDQPWESEFQNILFTEENNKEIRNSPTFRQQQRESELSSQLHKAAKKHKTVPHLPLRREGNRCQSYSPAPQLRSYSPLNIREENGVKNQSSHHNLSNQLSQSQTSQLCSPNTSQIQANHNRSYTQVNSRNFEGKLNITFKIM